MSDETQEIPAVEEPPKALLEAMLRVQRDLPKLHKGETAKVKSQRTGGEYTYRYIGLDTVMEEVLPVLNRNGLVWITMPVDRGGTPMLHYRLIFADDGNSIDGEMSLPVDRNVDAQALGSAITYCRRYVLIALLGLAPDEDDDGAAAKAGQAAAQQRAQEARAGVQTLSEPRRATMLDAIREAGLDVAETLEKAGIDPDADVTVAQGRQVRALIEAAKPVEDAT